MPVAVATLLAFLLAPVVAALERRVGRPAAVLAVATLVLVLLGTVSWGVGRQLAALVEEVPRHQATIERKLHDLRGLVAVLVVLVLLERDALRTRLIGLAGPARLVTTTRALDEATARVSRYLLAQSAVNGLFGVGVGVGLALIGVPYALLWAFLAAALRFIPYLGPWIGALAPLAASLAMLEGWTRPAMVAGLFLALEAVTNLVLETRLQAGAAGVSSVGLVVALAFWSWLWGPAGLLLATPLTVCLVVLAKHTPGLDRLAALMVDAPGLEPDVACYQRLLAGDAVEAAALLDRHRRGAAPAAVDDALLLPALAYLVRDRAEGRITPEDARRVLDPSAELAADVAVDAPPAPRDAPVRILGVPAGDETEQLALARLGAAARHALRAGRRPARAARRGAGPAGARRALRGRPPRRAAAAPGLACAVPGQAPRRGGARRHAAGGPVGAARPARRPAAAADAAATRRSGATPRG